MYVYTSKCVRVNRAHCCVQSSALGWAVYTETIGARHQILEPNGWRPATAELESSLERLRAAALLLTGAVVAQLVQIDEQGRMGGLTLPISLSLFLYLSLSLYIYSGYGRRRYF